MLLRPSLRSTIFPYTTLFRSYVSVRAIVPPRLLRRTRQRPLEVAPVSHRLRHHRAGAQVVVPTGRHADLVHVVLTPGVVGFRPLGDRTTSVHRQRADELLTAEIAHPPIAGRVLHRPRHQTLRSSTRVPSG